MYALNNLIVRLECPWLFYSLVPMILLVDTVGWFEDSEVKSGDVCSYVTVRRNVLIPHTSFSNLLKGISSCRTSWRSCICYLTYIERSDFSFLLAFWMAKAVVNMSCVSEIRLFMIAYEALNVHSNREEWQTVILMWLKYKKWDYWPC